MALYLVVNKNVNVQRNTSVGRSDEKTQAEVKLRRFIKQLLKELGTASTSAL